MPPLDQADMGPVQPSRASFVFKGLHVLSLYTGKRHRAAIVLADVIRAVAHVKIVSNERVAYAGHDCYDAR